MFFNVCMRPCVCVCDSLCVHACVCVCALILRTQAILFVVTAKEDWLPYKFSCCRIHLCINQTLFPPPQIIKAVWPCETMCVTCLHNIRTNTV